jgi:predicted RNase H-like nuclease
MLILVEIIQSIERQQTVTTIVKKGRSLQVTKRKQYPVLIINKYRKSRVVASKSKVDKELCTLVDYYNEQLRLVNKHKTPRISQDIIVSRKGKHIAKVQYQKNFSVYTDGIYPNRKLTMAVQDY